MSHLVKIINDRNEEALPTQFLIIPDFPSHIDRNKKSWCLGDFNQDSILPQYLELDQYQFLDILASFPLNEIELDYECDPDPQLCDLILIFEYILTPVSLSDLDPMFEPTLIPAPIELEIESPILDSHISLIGKKF